MRANLDAAQPRPESSPAVDFLRNQSEALRPLVESKLPDNYQSMPLVQLEIHLQEMKNKHAAAEVVQKTLQNLSSGVKKSADAILNQK